MAGFDRPSDFDIWNHMRTMNEFRVEMELESSELRKTVDAMNAELKEIMLCISIFRRIVPWFWAVLMFVTTVAGTIIGMLYKLLPPGSL